MAPGFVLAENQNFCPDGVFARASVVRPKGLQAWGSYCSNGDKDTGRAVTSAFPAPHRLSLYLAGQPSDTGLSLQLEHMSDGSRLSLKPNANPGAIWTRYDFPVPEKWVGSPVRLIAEDRATAMAGWLAFSEPIQPEAIELPRTGVLFWRTAWHFVFTMVPCFALGAFGAWKGIRDPLMLGGLALVGIAMSAYLAFWAWFLSPHFGHAVSVALAVAAGGVLIWLIPKLSPAAWASLKLLLVPALLVFCASLTILAAGFLYGGMDAPLVTPRTRFSHQLMGDNVHAFEFAAQVQRGHVNKPMSGDWHSSDRPPLQTGMVLTQWPFLSRPRPLGYTMLGAIQESLWIFASWLLLDAFHIARRAISLALAIPLFSGFVFLNTFYLWPKLLAGAFMLAFAALVLPRDAIERLRASPSAAVLAGALLAFGLLTHGASIFALIGIVIAGLILRIKIPVKRIALMGSVCFLLYLPWILYQKLFDPPGDRLLKWHLAGVIEVDPRPFLQVLTNAYAHLTFAQLLHNRGLSAGQFFDHNQNYWTLMARLVPALVSGNDTRVADLLSGERVFMFFNLFPALGFLIIGLPALAAGLSRRYRSLEWRAAIRILVFVFCTLLACWVLMFPPEAGAIFVQPYVTVLLTWAGSTLALWAVSRWLAVVIGGLQVGLSFLAYGIYMREPGMPGVLTEGALQYGNLGLFVAAVIGVTFLLSRVPGYGTACNTNSSNMRT